MKFPLFREMSIDGKVYYWEPIVISDECNALPKETIIVEDIIPLFPEYKPNFGKYFINDGMVLCVQEFK